MEIFRLSFILFVIFLNLFIYSCSEINCDNCISDGLNCFHKDASNNLLCDQKCKPKYGVTSKCYLCNFEDYYYIGQTEIEGQNVEICNRGCIGSYIIDSSKECVSSSTDLSSLKKMGHVYFKNCPLYSIIDGDGCKCLYKYYIEKYNEKEIYHCLSQTSPCPDVMKLYDYEDKECTSNSDCEGTKIKKYENNGNIRCHSTCIGDEFYKTLSDNIQICVDSCESLIYIDSNNNKKLCLDNCPTVTSGDALKIKNNNCIAKSQCNFYDDDDDFCLNSCKESNGKPYHNKNDKKCISECDNSNGYYLNKNDNICYQTSDTKCKFFKENSGQNICLSACSVEDGFISTEGTPNKCHNSCPGSTKKYYNHGENICLAKCSINNKLYHKQGEFECFSSCKDIDGTLIYAKSDTDGAYSCHSSPPSGCAYYFPLNNGVKLCVDLEYCTGRNYKYLKGNECIEECNDFKAIDNSETPSSMIQCLLELSDCDTKEFNFYNINEKKCWKNLLPEYCRKSNDNSNDFYEVIPINDNYYYEDTEQIKFCVSSCKAVDKYIDFVDKKNV